MTTSIIQSTTSPAEWLTAVGTLLAVVVALGLGTQNQLRAIFFGPRLDVAIRRGPPDCHVILMDTPTSQRLAFFCRMEVTSNRRATGVEVRMTRLWRRMPPANEYVEDKDYLPLSLTWTNRPRQTVLPVVDHGILRQCDLCSFNQPYEGEEAYVQFATEVLPKPVAHDRWPTIKPPGHYRAEIAVTADNAKTIYRWLEIAFTGTWHGDVALIAELDLRVEVTPAPKHRRG